MKNLLFIFLSLASVCLNAQGVAISPHNSSPDSSAALDLNFTNKGFLPPRLTTAQMNTIAKPASGLMIYNTDCNMFDYWNGGGWVAIGSIGSLTTPGTITGNTIPCENATGISYSTAPVAGATSYNWTVPTGATVASGQGTNSITVNFGTINGNVCVTASNACGASNASCAAITLSTAPSAPAASTHTPSATQIVWNWNTSTGATGYKWNTLNDYATATDVGNSTTYTQTGLTCNTPYTLYVWAYNACGNSATTIALTQTTTSCCTDGTGGSITHIGSNTIHTFISSGTFTPNCAMNIQVLVVAGGGGGGDGGGGGAGGYIYNSSYAVNTQSYSVIVGTGGAGGAGTSNASNGGNSVFDALTATGGGGGGSGCSSVGSGGGSGGGGGACGGANISGAQGTSGQGNAGGNTGPYYGSSPYPSGGGGGAGAAGQDGVSGSVAGNGGIGLQNGISGSPVYYAGGGGGGINSGGGTAGTGGTGGGGNGCGTTSSCSGSPGVDHTGGGGGGCATSGVGGVGGSGVVIISYPTP